MGWVRNFLNRPLEEKTVGNVTAGALVVAIVTIFIAEPVKSGVKGLWDSITFSLSNKNIEVSFPAGTDFDPGTVTVGIIERDASILQAKSLKLEDGRSIVLSESNSDALLLGSEFRVVTAYTWHYVTYVNTSDILNLRHISKFTPPKIGAENYKILTVYDILDDSESQRTETTLGKDQLLVSNVAWIRTAAEEIGTSEASESGKRRIADYWNATDQPGLDSTHPWGCAYLVWALRESTGGAPRNGEVCASWQNYGQPLRGPKLGAIAFVPRDMAVASVSALTGREVNSGISGIVVGWDENKVALLAGNIQDSVKIELFPRDRVLSFSWPAAGSN